MGAVDRATLAQQTVIGSMLIDDRCVPLVLQKLTEADFIDPVCRNFFRVIRGLALEGRPIDPVPVLAALKNGDDYIRWCREVMDATPTAANVGEYIPLVRQSAQRRRVLELAGKLAEADAEEMRTLVQQMSSTLSAADRMPRMTGAQLAKDFLARMGSQDKPRYLPWGVPTADRNTYAELGDMVLLGGYPSSGKTLLSMTMAMAQAKAGYKVGYYSLETKPEKLADRIFASLSKVPLDKIKTRAFGDYEWEKFAQSSNLFASVCPFDVVQAAGSTVEDLTADAIGRGYQIIYVDYVQLLRAAGVRDSDGYARVTAVSQSLKAFAQSTSTAVVALAQLARPESTGSKNKDQDPIKPTMTSFKESGQLEQDADAAFLVFPSNRYKNDSPRYFSVVKNKEGRRPAPVMLAFYGDTQTMVEIVSEAEFEPVRGKSADNPWRQ